MTEMQLRTKAVNVMVGWLGLSEVNGGHRKIIDIYNSQKPLPVGYKVKYTDDWCAAGVSAAFIQAGIPEVHCPECSCPRMIDKYKAKGLWMEKDNYVPKIGDLIMYDWEDKGTGDNTGTPNHVGMVAQVNGMTMKIVECNKGDKVAYRTMSVNARYIRGYCLPDFGKFASNQATNQAARGAKTVTITLNQLKRGDKGAQVEALQALLIGKDFGCGSSGIDGSFGPATDAAVRKFQKAHGSKRDGIVGVDTWSALLGAHS